MKKISLGKDLQQQKGETYRQDGVLKHNVITLHLCVILYWLEASHTHIQGREHQPGGYWFVSVIQYGPIII